MHDSGAVAFATTVSLGWCALALAWIVRRSGIVPCVRRRWRSGGPFARIAALAALVAVSVYGGSKSGGTNQARPGGNVAAVIPRPASPASTAGGAPGQGGDSSTNGLRFSAFSFDGEDRFDFSVAWSATNLAEYAAIDVFHKRALDDPAWRWICRREVWLEDGEDEFSLSGGDLPYWEEVVSRRFRVNTNEVESPFGVVFTNVYARVEALSDAAPRSAFFMLADQSDADGDGLSDAIERSLGYDPLDPDMDGDGVPDGQELLLGANPLSADSDGDGLLDGEEVSHGRYSVDGLSLWIDASEAGTRTVLFTDTDDDCLSVPMPFPIRIAGSSMTNLTVNANGLVGFSAGEAAFGSGMSSNGYASSLPLANAVSATVAAFWDDLLVRTGMDSEVSLSACGEAPERVAVVEFSRVGFYSGTTNDCVSFQVQFREDETNLVHVVFSGTSGLGTGASATLGARSSRDDGMEYSCNARGTVFPGLHLEYRFGLGSSPALADTDGDGLADPVELELGTDPCQPDTDGDGLPDGQETGIGTNPLFADTDGDGIGDKRELDNPPLDPLDPSDGPSDTDGDGLSNAFEITQSHTDWTLADTDGDGLSDGAEWNGNTDPVNPDTDGDGLPDGQELALGTDPCNSDTDGDGMPDGWEEGHGLNPASDDSAADSDGDGLSNLSEYSFGTDPGEADSDGDGISDGDETNCGTNPLQPDTDGDGLSDGEEIAAGRDPKTANTGTDAADADADGDGLTNGQEASLGTDWDDTDSDGDGVSDYDEWRNGSDPLDFEDSEVRHVFTAVVHFGDDSASRSEKYKVTFAPISGDPRPPISLSNRQFGNPDNLAVHLVSNAVYEVSLQHLASNRSAPDLDYVLMIELTGGAAGMGVLVLDQEGVLGSWSDVSMSQFRKKAVIAVVHARILADLNRDGVIDGTDAAAAAVGVPLRIWLNDDDDSGAVQESSTGDIPGASSPDSGNDVVDGLSDLVDFFPVHIDFGAALETILDIPGVDSSKVEVLLSCDGAALGCVETDFTSSEAGKHLSDPAAGVENAAVVPVGTSAAALLSQSLVSAMEQDGSAGVVLLEGKARSAERTAATLTAEIRYDGQHALSVSLPVLVAPIKEFYRWYSFRSDTGGPVSSSTDTREPAALPDDATDRRHVVFIHGFNVDEDGARGWNAEMFKRLWQSGCNSVFHAVTWRGDCGLPSGLFYHDNVHNAFLTAPAFAFAFSSNASNTTVLAHSLGNMVVCSAIQDHGFRPASFFMLNAAVPAEAFDASLGADRSASNPLVHPDWHDYDSRTWSARWHELFAATDDRSKLTWRGRFADVADRTNLFNFHSGTAGVPGDEVLQIRDTPPEMLDDLHYGFPASLDMGHYSWHKQEMGKGRLTVVNPFIAGTTCAGWGFHETNVWIEVGEQLIRIPYAIEAAEANAMTTDELRRTPVFRRTPAVIFQSVISDSDIAHVLAAGIPALSAPAGSRMLSGLENVDLNQAIPKTHWPRGAESTYKQRWLHSDIKNVAFPVVFDVFSAIGQDSETPAR